MKGCHMMQSKRFFAIALLFVSCSIVAEPAKHAIHFVNPQKLMADIEKEFQGKQEALGKKFEAEIKTLETSKQELQKKYQSGDAKDTSLQTQAQALQAKEQALQAKIQKEAEPLQKAATDKVTKRLGYIEEIRAEKGWSAVVLLTEMVIAYDKSLDVTDVVVTELKKKESKSAAAPAKDAKAVAKK